MFSQPLTLAVVLADRLVRADFKSSRAAEPSQFAVRERPEIDDPASLVEVALSLVSKRPGRTFVLLGDAWTHTLGVPLANLRNTTPDDVRQMLAFDAEPLSNLSAFDAATGMLPLGDVAGTRTYWVTQIGMGVRDQIVDAVQAAGGKFAGVLHPAGVPQGASERSVAAGGTEAGAGRIEYWPGVVARTAIRSGKLVGAKVDDSGIGVDREEAAEAWRTEANVAAVETLDAMGRRSLDGLGALDLGGMLNLSDDATLRHWLAAWNRALGSRATVAPVVTAPARPMTQRQQGMIAAVLGLAVLGACYAHGRWVEKQIATANAEQNIVEGPGKEVDSIKQQKTTIEKELTKIREEAAKLRVDVTQAETLFESHRRRLPELLRRLSADSSASRDWVLQKISGSGRELTLGGLTMHPEHISRLASELSVDLEPLGWGVEPPKQDARNVAPSGGPWAFELKLVDRRQTVPAPSAAPQAPTDPIAGSVIDGSVVDRSVVDRQGQLGGPSPSKVIIRTP